MSRPAALILAGGEGNRLGGVRKAALKFGGQRLLDHIGAVLAPHCAPIFVSTGPAGRASMPLPAEMIDVADLDLPIGGPLAGIIALAHRLETASTPPDLVATVAVDTPLLPRDFVPVLVERLPASAPAAYVTHGENFYPTNTIWRRAALAALSARTGSGTPPKSLRAVLEDIGATAISWPSTAASADPFANINTLADLLALTRRAREEIGIESRPIGENRK